MKRDIAPELTKIVKDTGASFLTVGRAAEEFARQGLSADQIVSRTRDVIILMQIINRPTDPLIQ